MQENKDKSLDPEDWPEFRRLAHTMLDKALDHMENYSERPVWQTVPDEVKLRLQEPLPLDPQGNQNASDDLVELVLPYPTGNTHPRFFGWVHGSGTPGGLIAEMMAAAMNSNLGGRDHGAIYVERQVIEWCRTLFGFPPAASGLVVSGTSMATLIAVKIARDHALGDAARSIGIQQQNHRLVAYASSEAHACISKAFDILGLGTNCLRSIPVNRAHQMDIVALEKNIAADRKAGLQPFCLIGTAGSVNVGSIDNLDALANLSEKYGLWFHIDGAFGALGILSDQIKPRLQGIARADSLAFDFHKWMHVNYDAGFVLVRDGDAHRRAFSSRPDYLAAEESGLAGGNPWFCEYGLELSRGFRALKVWFAIKEHGLKRLGDKISENCQQAQYLAMLVKKHDRFELLAPVAMNIVCFRYNVAKLSIKSLNQINRKIVVLLQERGLAAPSVTMLGKNLAIRVNITNHRSHLHHFDELIDDCDGLGQELLAAGDDSEQ